MKSIRLILLLPILIFSCTAEKEDKTEDSQISPPTEIAFDSEKWKTKTGEDYPHRDGMLKEVVYNDTIRSLSKNQLLKLLGKPDYIREGHLYYRIKETRLGSWSIKTKTMVVKIKDDKKIEWIKIHE